MTDQLSTWIDEAFAIGMFQHRAEIEPFVRWLVADVQPARILEIGSWKGGSTYLWGRIVGKHGRVVSIDKPLGAFGGADAGITEEVARVRNRKIAERLDGGPIYNGVGILWGICGDSHDPNVLSGAANSSAGSKPLSYDLLFIDGDHSYRGVRQDWEWYRWLVRPGGWVAFHDILSAPFHKETGCEVDRLWEEINAQHGFRFQTWTGGDQTWGGIGAVQV